MCQCTTELWAPIPGFEGSYEVSTCGRIRSLDRTVTRRDGVAQPCRGRMLRPGTDKAGYQYVCLRQVGESGTRRIHELVLRAFIGPPPPNTECCHRDGAPASNHLPNLRWDTRSGNRYDDVRNGAHRQSRKTRCPLEHQLIPPNLVPSELPGRKCLACDRAHANQQQAHKSERPFDLRAAADSHYIRIMSVVKSSPTPLIIT
jgi:hypothetical protein